MKIWFIHPYAGSPKRGMSFRPYYFCKHFQNMGHKVVVISSSFHHLSSFTKIQEGLQSIEDVPYYLVKTSSYSGNGIKRIFNMFNFGISLFGFSFRSFAANNIPDVIIASTAHPFHFLAAKYYADKYKAKLILEVRDIWPLSLQELIGISKFHPFTLMINLFQRYAYRNCDHCVSLLENAESFFIQEGLKHNSFTCIPNGVELYEKQPTKDEFLLKNLVSEIKNFDTVIGYTGAIGIPNNLLPLIEASKELEGFNIGILLVGDGIEKQNLQSRVQELNLKNVIFIGKVAKDQIEHILPFCDAMFINAQPKPLYKLGISPNKIFDYMLHNKFVFNGIDSPNNPLEKSSSEIKFDANSPFDISSKIIKFHNLKGSRISNASDYVKQNYTYEKLAIKYVNLFKILLKL